MAVLVVLPVVPEYPCRPNRKLRIGGFFQFHVTAQADVASPERAIIAVAGELHLDPNGDFRVGDTFVDVSTMAVPAGARRWGRSRSSACGW